jgi:hypothetical protein
VVKKIIRRGDISHVEGEKERLGDKYDPANEGVLESLPYDFPLNELSTDNGIRAPLSVVLPPPVKSEISTSVQSKPNSIISLLSDRYNIEREALGKLLNKNIPKENIDDKSNDKTFIKRQYDKGHNLYVKGANTVQKIDNAIGATENFLGVDSDLSSTNDKFAIEGGAKYLSGSLIREEERITKRREALLSEKLQLASLEESQRYQSLKYNEKIEQLSAKYKLINKIENKTDENVHELAKISTDIDELVRKKESLDNKVRDIKNSADRIKDNLRQNELLLKENRDRKAEYEKSIIIGKLKYQKEHGAGVEARRFAKDFSDNVTSMIGAPTIGDISAQVGYGDIGAKSVSSGINTMFGNYKLNPGANEWVKTKAGDRGLVEALVKVNQNNMITPFGAPGTIQNSKLGSQFNYNLPVRQIGVGEVTARPGYRLTPEDVHRKKNLKTKPLVIRKSSKSNIKKVTVKGNLSMNMKSPVIATIGNMKSNSVKLTMDNIAPFTSKNFEINLNTISKPILKKKLIKGKI